MALHKVARDIYVQYIGNLLVRVEPALAKVGVGKGLSRGQSFVLVEHQEPCEQAECFWLVLHTCHPFHLQLAVRAHVFFERQIAGDEAKRAKVVVLIGDMEGCLASVEFDHGDADGPDICWLAIWVQSWAIDATSRIANVL